VTPKEIADEMRAGIREVFLGEEWKPGGEWWPQIKRLMPPRMKHDYKKKFLNGPEALWFAIGRGFPDSRAYQCPLCPFWHLSSKPWFNRAKVTQRPSHSEIPAR
jgi:hypothetical protein